MIPKSLSATSVAAFENCPARWRAEFFDKAPQPTNEAAALGLAVHGALEDFIVNGYKPQGDDKAAAMLENYFFHHYHDLFSDESRKAEGLTMCRTWFERTDLSGRTVLSTEKKDTFLIPTSAGKIPFNYLWDRCDKLDDKVLEVIDYKTIARPISPDGLKDKIQARCYGLAAQLQYPDAERVWVTFDLLRYDPVGIVFTKDDNRATWKYLKQ